VLLLLWQQRRLIGIQLHVEGNEQRRRPGVIGHQRDEIDQSTGTEVLQSPGEGLRRHLPRAEDLASQFDDDCVGMVEAARVEAALDDFDDVAGDAFAESFGLMRCPLETTVELPGGGENGQLANASSQPRFVSQIAIERSGIPREVRTMEKNTARTPEPPERPPSGSVRLS
jgi:hypothetical protein